jgi:hypothetical protein
MPLARAQKRTSAQPSLLLGLDLTPNVEVGKRPTQYMLRYAGDDGQPGEGQWAAEAFVTSESDQIQ